MLNQILALIFSLTGYLFGLILSFIAPEELKPGKKYFLIIRKILFYLIILSALFFFIYLKNYYFLLIPLGYLILYFLIIKRQNSLKQEIFNYGFFVLVSFLFLIIPLEINLFMVFLSLIFLYGLPAGTLKRIKKRKLI